jgi:hypothetical protein
MLRPVAAIRARRLLRIIPWVALRVVVVLLVRCPWPFVSLPTLVPAFVLLGVLVTLILLLAPMGVSVLGTLDACGGGGGGTCRASLLLARGAFVSDALASVAVRRHAFLDFGDQSIAVFAGAPYEANRVRHC